MTLAKHYKCKYIPPLAPCHRRFLVLPWMQAVALEETSHDPHIVAVNNRIRLGTASTYKNRDEQAHHMHIVLI